MSVGRALLLNPVDSPDFIPKLRPRTSMVSAWMGDPPTRYTGLLNITNQDQDIWNEVTQSSGWSG